MKVIDMCVRGVDWEHMTSLIPLLFIEVPVACYERKERHIYVC